MDCAQRCTSQDCCAEEPGRTQTQRPPLVQSIKSVFRPRDWSPTSRAVSPQCTVQKHGATDGLTPIAPETPQAERKDAAPADRTPIALGNSQQIARKGVGQDNRAPYHGMYIALKKRSVYSKPKEFTQSKPPHTFPDGAVYVGEWRCKKRHGQGMQVWPNGAKYNGQWADGKTHGDGRFEHGSIYEGEWREGKVHGQGVCIALQGAMYDGQFENDMQHGHGSELWPDGLQYTGQYKHGKKAGQGRFCWSHGRSYEGEFLDNEMHGAGVIRWEDGRQYSGQVTNGKINGSGLFTWADGRSPQSEYADEAIGDDSTLKWPDGHWYEGQWKDGKQHGVGTLFSTQIGEKTTGIWEEGVWVQTATKVRSEVPASRHSCLSIGLRQLMEIKCTHLHAFEKYPEKLLDHMKCRHVRLLDRHLG